MTTIATGTIEYEIHRAPTSPLNLRLGTIYCPRNGMSGAFVGYSCVEVTPGHFVVAAWKLDRTTTVWEGDDLARAYRELAIALDMA